jgi:CubicO group peptidase (beta-lactamase class C family)
VPALSESVGRDFSAISPIVQAYVDENGLNGAGLIVVDREDGVVYEDYWGEFRAERISLIASSSKMITAGVLLHLDDLGVLDIDAPVADVVEWGSANPDITPAQLISNSSGLVGLLDAGNASYPCQFSPTTTLQACGESIFTTPDDDADVIAPDTEFRYGGAQWQVAGAVAEAASGMAWDDLVDEIFVQPCGLRTLAYNNPFLQLGVAGFEYPTAFDGDPATLAPVDNPNMEGGAYTTTGDYAELLLLHLRDGMCGDTQVLSPDALDRMHRDRVAEAYAGDAATDNPGYGMGWWVDRESGRISDPGAFGTVPWLDLENGYGAYLVIEATSILGQGLAEQLFGPVEDAVLG